MITEITENEYVWTTWITPIDYWDITGITLNNYEEITVITVNDYNNDYTPQALGVIDILSRLRHHKCVTISIR